MNYAKIIPYDIVNGLGVRTSLFVSGCDIHCAGCFNQVAWDYQYGKLYTDNTEEKIMSYIHKDWVAGLSILGGDPMRQSDSDINAIITLCNKVTACGKNIWLWSGMTLQQIHSEGTPEQKALLKSVDVFIDGPFVESMKDLSLAWRGSSNQHIHNMRFNQT